MSEEETRVDSFDKIIEQVESELKNNALKELKKKVADKVKARAGHQRSIDQINVEIAKMITDAKNGIY